VNRVRCCCCADSHFDPYSDSLIYRSTFWSAFCLRECSGSKEPGHCGQVSLQKIPCAISDASCSQTEHMCTRDCTVASSSSCPSCSSSNTTWPSGVTRLLLQKGAGRIINSRCCVDNTWQHTHDFKQALNAVVPASRIASPIGSNGVQHNWTTAIATRSDCCQSSKSAEALLHTVSGIRTTLRDSCCLCRLTPVKWLGARSSGFRCCW
jgi:hypothetical protein